MTWQQRESLNLARLIETMQALGANQARSDRDALAADVTADAEEKARLLRFLDGHRPLTGFSELADCVRAILAGWSDAVSDAVLDGGKVNEPEPEWLEWARRLARAVTAREESVDHLIDWLWLRLVRSFQQPEAREYLRQLQGEQMRLGRHPTGHEKALVAGRILLEDAVVPVTRRRRVAFLVDQPYVGGVQWHLALMADFMARERGVDARLFFRTDKGCAYNTITPWLNERKVPWEMCPLERVREFDAWLGERLGEFAPDVVNFGWISPLPEAALSGNWRKHLIFSGPGAAALLDSPGAERIDRVIGVSKEMRLFVPQDFGDRYTTVYAGLPLEMFREVETQTWTGLYDPRHSIRDWQGIPPEALVISWVGRLHAEIEKRPDILRQVIERLADRENVYFLICAGRAAGNDRVRDDWEWIATQHPRVRLFWDTKPWEMPNLLAACDVSLCTSDLEGLSTTTMEAMAAALPVVTTAAPGQLELMREGITGYFVPKGDVDGLVDRLVRLLDAPASVRQAMGMAGRVCLEQSHTLAADVDGHLALLG